MAKLSAAERTMLKPTRATAMRRSAIFLPDVLSAAEFAMLRSLLASTGSEPSTLTTVSLLTFSSASARCILSTMSGTDGRSTLPDDSSCASAFTKPNTTVLGIAREVMVLVVSAWLIR
jgi:hypothetical protein